MNIIESQIGDLAEKVDSLREIIERLSYQVTDLASDVHHQKQQTEIFANVAAINSHSFSERKNHNSIMEHKDILLDSNSWENDATTKSEQMLSPDIQIRRLTAQLTAAYNRIAALEEQLLSRRVHS